MNSRFKSIVLAILVVGSLVASAGPSLARENWHRRHHNHRWTDGRWNIRDGRQDLQRDHADLAWARRQREFDRRHRAGRWRRAWERQHIHDLRNDIRNDRRDLRRDRRGWFDWD